MDPRIQAHARVIVRYSTRLKAGETVGIYGSTLAIPLMEAVYKEALAVGAFPFLRVSVPSIAPYFFRHANKKQLTRVSDLDWAEARGQHARVVILSDSNTRALSGADPSKIAMSAKARRPLKEYVINKTRWCLTLHPTEALAQEADMSLEEYQDFVYGALFCDKKDPLAPWKKIEKIQAGMIRKLKGAERVHIIGQDTDLTFSIKNRLFVNSPATNNLPSGEIFTAPVETSTEGHVYFDIPTSRDGVRVEGMRVEFKKGRVVKARADRGEDYMRKMLAMDEGAGRLGEFGIGTNFGIQRPTCEILFDEKIGGTIHLAFGSAYRECKGRNVSALHWDMIKHLRAAPGRRPGRVEFYWKSGRKVTLTPGKNKVILK